MNTTVTAKSNSKHVQDYLEYLRKEGRVAPLTIDTYKSILQGLGRRLAERRISFLQMRTADIEKEIREARERGAKPSSVALLIATTKTFFRHLVRKGLVTENPVAHIPAGKAVSQDPPRLLSSVEMDALLSYGNCTDAKDRRNLLMFKLLATTPMKVGRVCVLKLGEINLATGIGPTVRKKRGRHTKIKIKDPLLTELRDYVENDRPGIVLNRDTNLLFPSQKGSRQGHLTRQSIWFALKRSAKRVGVSEEIRLKDLPASYNPQQASLKRTA